MNRNRFSAIQLMNSVLIVLGIFGGGVAFTHFMNEQKNLKQKYDEQIAKLEAAEEIVVKLEILQAEISRAQSRLDEQSTALSAVRSDTINEIEKNVAPIIDRLESIEASNGPQAIDLGCIHLDKAYPIEGGKSYDFCNVDWTLQISEIKQDKAVLRSNALRVPGTYVGKSMGEFYLPKHCTLELLQTRRNSNQSFVVIARGSCSS